MVEKKERGKEREGGGGPYINGERFLFIKCCIRFFFDFERNQFFLPVEDA